MRRRTRAAFALALLAASACSQSPERRAERLDARYGTGIFSWLAAHEPSGVDVLGATVSDVAPLDPRADVVPASGGAAAATGDLRPACDGAKAGRAVLFIVYPADPRARARAAAAALDCGYAIARDDGGIVVAPR